MWLYIFNEGHFLDITKLACSNLTVITHMVTSYNTHDLSPALIKLTGSI